MTRVALYLRVSIDEQAKGHSLDSQRDTLREWARGGTPSASTTILARLGRAWMVVPVS